SGRQAGIGLADTGSDYRCGGSTGISPASQLSRALCSAGYHDDILLWPAGHNARSLRSSVWGVNAAWAITQPASGGWIAADERGSPPRLNRDPDRPLPASPAPCRDAGSYRAGRDSALTRDSPAAADIR